MYVTFFSIRVGFLGARSWQIFNVGFNKNRQNLNRPIMKKLGSILLILSLFLCSCKKETTYLSQT